MRVFEGRLSEGRHCRQFHEGPLHGWIGLEKLPEHKAGAAANIDNMSDVTLVVTVDHIRGKRRSRYARSRVVP